LAGLVHGDEQADGFSFVLGLEALLLAGDFVFEIKDAPRDAGSVRMFVSSIHSWL
jgi:hypothetical protein